MLACWRSPWSRRSRPESAFGLAPALRASRPTLQAVLGATRNAGGTLARRRLSESLVVAQIALGVVLVAGAGLLIKSFWRLHQVELGFRRRAGDCGGHSDSRASLRTRRGACARVLQCRCSSEVRAIPGVRSAAVASVLPFGGVGSMQSSFAADIEAHPVAAGRLGADARAHGRERRLLPDDGHPAPPRTRLHARRIARAARRWRSWTSSRRSGSGLTRTRSASDFARSG